VPKYLCRFALHRVDGLSVIQPCFFLTMALYQSKDYDDGLHSTQTN